MTPNLGNFNPHADVDAGALEKAHLFLALLPPIPAGLIQRIYLHWTVSGMCSDFADYNAEARLNRVGGSWELKVETNPQNNAPGLNDDPVASHTWLRNTGALGIAITGMDGSSVDEHHFGLDPVTVAGLTLLCAGAAALAVKYNVDVAGTSTDVPYQGEPTIMTHAEAANRPGIPPPPGAYDYGPGGTDERWDLSTLAPLPANIELTAEMASRTGDALRELIRTYKVALQS